MLLRISRNAHQMKKSEVAIQSMGASFAQSRPEATGPSHRVRTC